MGNTLFSNYLGTQPKNRKWSGNRTQLDIAPRIEEVIVLLCSVLYNTDLFPYVIKFDKYVKRKVVFRSYVLPHLNRPQVNLYRFMKKAVTIELTLKCVYGTYTSIKLNKIAFLFYLIQIIHNEFCIKITKTMVRNNYTFIRRKINVETLFGRI